MILVTACIRRCGEELWAEQLAELLEVGIVYLEST